MFGHYRLTTTMHVGTGEIVLNVDFCNSESNRQRHLRFETLHDVVKTQIYYPVT